MPPARRSAPKNPGVDWSQAQLADVVLIHGPEQVLAERATDVLVRQAANQDPNIEVTRVEAAAYESGSLSYLASPSLFGEQRLILVAGVEASNDAFLSDAVAYLAAPADGVWLVLRHGGGVRGKKLLDAVRDGGYPVVGCEALKKDSDKMDFVLGEFRAAHRRIDAAGAKALVDAVGSELRELAAACQQLISDTDGHVTAAVVDKYYGGRVEATGFKVADAAITGQRAQALSMLRHALATGADPVPIVAALAAKVRTLAKVAAVRGRSGGASDLGMAPWLVDKAKRELAQWTPEGLAAAIAAIARADAEVKGASRDPVFAVERAVMAVCSAHGR